MLAHESLARVVVVGTSCSGKSTFARELARRLDSRYVELDELYWAPEWTPNPQTEFLRLTDAATTGPRWVVDGNYGAVRELVWPRATSIIWLNFSLPTVFGRALWRTVRRSLLREALFAGNRETFRRAFLSRDSILLWVLTSYGPRRHNYPSLRAEGRYPNAGWVELHRPAEASAFLHGVGGEGH